jgi:hypothetical protein
MKYLNSNNNDEDILFLECNEFYKEIKNLQLKKNKNSDNCKNC